MIFDRFGNPAPRFEPLPRPACAPRHNDPAAWKSSGFDDRGYERLICESCKRLIGYRPPETLRQKAKRATEAIESDE